MAFIRNTLRSVKRFLVSQRDIEWIKEREWNDFKSPKMNLGQMQAAMNEGKKGIEDFSRVEFQVFSQFGDDGIIQWLTSVLPFVNKTFVEFGVENYRESNTRFLLFNNYWSGFVLDGSDEHIASMQNERSYIFYDIVGKSAFITIENINELLKLSGFGRPLDILSIDIDGNDYWVWNAITEVDPVLIICEYNSLFGFEDPITISYKPNFVRGEKYPFAFYGVSLRSACDLAESRGYTFIGCNSAGNNAYFLKSDWVKHLPKAQCAASEGYRFSSFTESREASGTPTRGLKRIMSLDGLPVINTRTGKEEVLNAKAITESVAEHNKVARC